MQMEQLQNENPELKQIYNSARNIYDVTSELIEMLVNENNFENFDSLAEIYNLIYLTKESAVSDLSTLPIISELSDYELPKYWNFFFINTLELLAQKKGESFSLDDDFEFKFEEEQFILQAKAWVEHRLERMPVLNVGTEGLETVNQYLFDSVLAEFTDGNKEKIEALDENEQTAITQHWTVQINEALEKIQEKFLPIALHLHKEKEYPCYYELIKYYPVSLAYIFVNEQCRTNLDLFMLSAMLQVCKNGTLLLLADFKQGEQPINKDELIGHLILDTNASVRWYDNAMDFFNECAGSSEQDEEQEDD